MLLRTVASEVSLGDQGGHRLTGYSFWFSLVMMRVETVLAAGLWSGSFGLPGRGEDFLVCSEISKEAGVAGTE